MKSLLKTNIGRLRILAYLEGSSLLLLIFIGVPLKYFLDEPSFSQYLGPIHGALFLIFLLQTLSVSIEENWKFKTTTWKILGACFIPFGTFYIDLKFLRKKRLHNILIGVNAIIRGKFTRYIANATPVLDFFHQFEPG